MKIQNDLVWDKNTGEHIGFLELGDIDLSNSTIQNVDKLPPYVNGFHAWTSSVRIFINKTCKTMAMHALCFIEMCKCVNFIPKFTKMRKMSNYISHGSWKLYRIGGCRIIILKGDFYYWKCESECIGGSECIMFS